jgi:DNA polymerase-1
MKRLYLIDVSSLFFRAFYAIRQLNNAAGQPTNALYGFLAAVTKILKEHKPEGLAFCYDRPESGFREEIYPDYKANRENPPDDLISQFPFLPKLAEALAIPGYEQAGYEADDVIGTLAKKSKRQGIEVVIVSGDKDFGQLVEPGVKIFDPSKDIYLDADGVRAKFGVNPDQVVDYLAIVGDASDNVPGVRGIGPKGAVKLLTEYQSLDGIYEHIDEIKNDRLRELLKTQKDQAYMSQKLCTIHCDMEIGIEPGDLVVKPVRRELLVPLLEELNFKSLLHRLLGEVSVPTEAGAPIGTQTTRPIIVNETVVSLEKPDVLVTGQISELESGLKTVKEGELWFDVTPRGTIIQSSNKAFRFEGDGDKFSDWLNSFLSSRKIKVSGFDTKNIAHQLKLKPEAFQSVGTDVMLQSYCTGRSDGVDFSELVKKHLGRELPEFAQPEERLFAIRQVSNLLGKSLAEGSLEKVLDSIEQPLSPVLYGMEKNGILIDSEKLNKFSKELLSEAQSLEKEICALAGYDFNVGSPKQLGQVLFEKLKLPTVRKTKTGYSTDSDVLEKLASQHPICSKILDWRELSKLRSTYVDAIPRLVDPLTGRVHTSFNQSVTSTGRLSSTHPNLQNIPIRSPRGQQIRESFIAPKGSVLISADYSQVELRILAHITGDPGLKSAFERDIDIHTATAAEIFNVKIESVTADHRRASKAINFGIAYGMSSFGLAESLSIENQVASEYIDTYFKRYPGVQRYMHEVVENGKRDTYVETLFGRRRYYPELNSSNGRLRQSAERAAINMPIQGAAADLIKLAMIKAAASLEQNKSSARMLLQVHDELVFEVSKDEADDLKNRIRDWMEHTVKLSVPLKVSIGVGPNWGEAH